MLPKLKRAIDKHVQFSRENSYFVPKGSDAEKRLNEAIQLSLRAENDKGLSLSQIIKNYDKDFSYE